MLRIERTMLLKELHLNTQRTMSKLRYTIVSPKIIRSGMALSAAILWSTGFVLPILQPTVAQEKNAWQEWEQEAESKERASAKVLAANSKSKESPEAQLKKMKGRGAGGVYFSFDRMPWRDVIQWISDEADLALHYEDLPTGSFSYTDPNPFTTRNAIDRLNLFLLPQGYTLVQSGTLLSVINLGDPRSVQTLDALARFVKVGELAELPKHDVVKCIFPLGELEVDDAIEELSVLNLMTQPSAFNKTKQLMLTDTVSKLENVKAILESFQPETLDNGTVMKNFALKHVEAEDILSVARPHLGLATGEMIGIDVSISADLQGKNIFVTGVDDKVTLIEGLITDLDVPQNVLSASDAGTELKSHLVGGGNVETVYNVLQTLLAGKEVRLSIDDSSSSIVALASPAIQQEIEQTVRQLEAAEPDFEIIDLKFVDPYFVISLLEEMLDLPTGYEDPDDVDPDAPTIDADPGNMRLFVRGKKHRIDQIRKIVEGLDVSQLGSEERLRVIPVRGEAGERLLRTGARLWNEENPVIFHPQDEAQQPRTERTLNGTPNSGPKLTASSDWGAEPAPRYLTNNAPSSAAPIHCEMTPRGIFIQSADTKALDAFEDSLRTIIGPSGTYASEPIVFYLKYVKPEDALRLLAELLEGGESAMEAETGNLVNGLVSGLGDYNPSILTTRDGLMTLLSGTITVVADPRLNRLITQGSTVDIDRVETYLKIIDKDKGITDIATYGSSHVVEIMYADVNEVAQTVRDAYATRVAGGSQGNASGGNPNGRDEARQREQEQDPKGKQKKNPAKGAQGGSATRNLEPVMTIAVHQASNSIIVTAPDQLFEEVRSLIQTLDTSSRQSLEVLSPQNSGLIQAVLGQSQGGSSRETNRRRSSNQSGNERFQSMLRDKFGGR
ncbi:MAG: secretin N-terminal domain-containing protein [Pirellulaceae bacterium]